MEGAKVVASETGSAGWRRLVLPICGAVLLFTCCKGSIASTVHWGEPILLSAATTGAAKPEKAFDESFSTAEADLAELEYYWGEAGHQDFMAFTCAIGAASTFSFKVMALANTGSSLVIYGYNKYTSAWDDIESVPLTPQYPSETIAPVVVIPDPQAYTTGGVIELRARWAGGAAAYDCNIVEIWRET